MSGKGSLIRSLTAGYDEEKVIYMVYVGKKIL